MNIIKNISKLLSKAAAIQGCAVPISRFEFLSVTESGLELSSLSTENKVIELWKSVFPQGEASIRNALPERDQYPAILIQGNAPPLLLRGMTSQQVIAEDAEGKTHEIRHQEVVDGIIIQINVSRISDASFRTPSVLPISAKGWFVHSIYKRRRVFLEGALATLLVGLFGLAASLYTMQVYDRVIPLKGYSTLFVLTLGVAIAIAMELVMKQVRAVMVERSCKAIDQELSGIFFSKAVSIRLDARPRTVGTFASQIRHFESVRNFMTSTTLMILADIPLSLLFIVVIGMIAGPIALVPLLAIPLAILTGYAFKSPIRSLTKDQIQESNYKNGLLIESIDGIESLKACGAEWKMQSKWNSLTKMLAGKELKLRLITNLSSQLTQTVHQATYVGIVAFGAYAVAEGSLTMGGLIACSIISSRALQPIAQLPSVVAQWQSASVSLEALDAIMEMPDDRPSRQHLLVPDGCRGALRIEDLKFQYDPSQNVLDVASLQILAGERVAILGAIGSGKSTLVKVLSGLYRPSEGRSFLDDIDIFQLAPEFVREHIAYLPQEIRLFNGTLRDNLTIGLPNPSDAVVLEAAKVCGLAASISKHPKGLDLMIQEGGRGLSGGQKQLVGLTRMLIAMPKVLLLDEPTASMDGQMELHVLQHLFDGLPKETTVVMATHKAASLQFVHRVIVMHQGSIVMDGSRDEVLKTLSSNTTAALSTSKPNNMTKE